MVGEAEVGTSYVPVERCSEARASGETMNSLIVAALTVATILLVSVTAAAAQCPRRTEGLVRLPFPRL